MDQRKKDEILAWCTGMGQGQTSTACQYLTEMMEVLNKYEKALKEIADHKDTYGLGTEPSFTAQEALK